MVPRSGHSQRLPQLGGELWKEETMFKLTNLWKVMAFFGAAMVVVGTGLKLFSLIPGLPHDLWEPSQLWGDVLPIFFGPVALAFAGAVYLGLNLGPLPGTIRLVEAIVAKIQPGESGLRWLAVFLAGATISFGGFWLVSYQLFFPGVFLVMESSWKGLWDQLSWQAPMLAAGTIGMAYVLNLYANVFYCSAEAIWPDEEAEAATEEAEAETA